MTDWTEINITDGTAQEERIPIALEPGYFDVDELAFEQLLAMGASYASVMSFFNLNNERDGNWGEVFNADEAVIMSMIVSMDLKRVENDFLCIPEYRSSERADFVLDLARKIDFWFGRLDLSEHLSGQALAQKLATLIEEKLVTELHTIVELAARVNANAAADGRADLDQFGAIWRLTERASDGRLAHSTVMDSVSSAFLQRQLRSSFYVFLNAISFIKQITPAYLQQSIKSQQHDPAIGLFMVFLKLYAKAQRKLNGFTHKHLDFYYRKMLKASNREQMPESLYLSIEPLPSGGKVLIGKNTEFSAGKDEGNNEIIYCAVEDAVVSGAKVESLATLYLHYDKLLSPESLLGYVGRIKSDVPLALAAQQAVNTAVSWPLFGAETRGSTSGAFMDARIGFCIASPLLLLHEGERKIDIDFEFQTTNALDVDQLISGLQQSQSEQEFTQWLGDLFARYLLSADGGLSSKQKDQIISKAHTALPDTAASEVEALLGHDWQALFYKLLKKIFVIRMTTESGWLVIDDYLVRPHSAAKAGGARMGITLNLGQDAVPVTAYVADVHGENLETSLPVLQCTINSQANFFPYSLFQHLIIRALQISVDVRGVKNVLAYNQHGQLDPSKPFQPFGPLPGRNAYLIFGNHELASKPLQALTLNLEWGELPQAAGGFADHYRDYGTGYSNAAFKGKFSVLADGDWQPRDRSARADVNLFQCASDGARLVPENSMALNILEYSTVADAGATEADYQYSLKTREGFFRLDLAGPESAFGHAEYPGLLTRRLAANARLKKPGEPPNPPYTPTLNRISLDYKASSTIRPGSGADEQLAGAERIIHLHPFGVELAYPVQADKRCYFMPQYVHAGNLFVGVSAKDLGGELTLFFKLAEDSARTSVDQRLSVEWFYLCSNSWKKIPAKRILRDTTNGFVSSGTVTISIPDDINRNNSVMPPELFWLRAASTQASCSMCMVHIVQSNVVKVTNAAEAAVIGSSGSGEMAKWTLVNATPGVGNISQIGEPFGGRPKETGSEFKARVSERLRHKNRALTPWDYEHLVLERFPEVYKVKCFANMSSTEQGLRPGCVLLVVVPYSGLPSAVSCSRVMMGVDALDQIRSYINELTSPFVKIEVRNPVYEQVQVRCTVKFTEGISDGINISRLNQDISNYICPWRAGGYRARFGWGVRQKDVESYIRNLGYVEFVTNFSMLHLTVDAKGKHRLFDTAKNIGSDDVVIRPRYPWSLAIPAKRHFIETTAAIIALEAEITGVNELEVGTTFIISGSGGYGEKK